MQKLLIATKNPAKFKRLSDLLKDYRFELVSLADLGITIDVPETQTTFEANARLKAQAYWELSRLPTLADDSGLEIDALNGWPGVYSRRVWGPQVREATDLEAQQEVLKRMHGIPPQRRTARFVVVVALAMPNGSIQVARGDDQLGMIAEQAGRITTPGFPYRSIFIRQGESLPESELEALADGREYLSHRKTAIIKLEPYFKQLENYA